MERKITVSGKFKCFREDGKRINTYEISFANSEGRYIFEDLGVDVRIILKFISSLM
jgi:hypothetical protein